MEEILSSGMPLGYGVVFMIESLNLPHYVSSGLITVTMFVVSTLRGYVVRQGGTHGELIK
jgi:hypothetical protein